MPGNYPSGVKAPMNTETDIICEDCGHHWEADGVYDLGTVTLKNPEDAKCSNCGKWSE